MVLKPWTRPQYLLQALSKQKSFSIRQQCRLLHNVPRLSSGKADLFAQTGVPGLFGADTYEENYLNYQRHLCDKLNELSAGRNFEQRPVRELLSTFSPTTNPILWNYASMADMNYNFWESLAKQPTDLSTAPGLGELRKDVDSSFGGIDVLREEILNHANSIFGNGWVWLMLENHRLKLLCTYNAGSPHRFAWPKRPMHTLGAEDKMSRPQNFVGQIGNHSRSGVREQNHEGQSHAIPILGVCVWQHVWIPDWGLLGKEDYLKAWWDRIDWNVVKDRYDMEAREESMSSRGYSAEGYILQQTTKKGFR